MTEHDLVRSLLRSAETLPAGDAEARDLLSWARANARWLLGLGSTQARTLSWRALHAGLREPVPAAAVPAGPLTLARELGWLLALDPTDSAVLAAMIAQDRIERIARLTDLLQRHGHKLPTLIGMAAGLERLEAERRVRNHPLLRCGLVRFVQRWHGGVALDLRHPLERLLDAAPDTAEAMIACLVGPRQPPGLPRDDFRHIADADMLVRLLRGARTARATGVNILIHGPPGTGKTEFARMLAAEAGLALYGAGEQLDDGAEPDRWDRIGALQIGQRLLASRYESALLLDEMEDLIGDAEPNPDNTMRGRPGSKVFFNRMLESNSVPVIWVTNSVGSIDPAYLRRMSYVLEMPYPSRTTALTILGRVAQEEGVNPDARMTALVDAAPEAASVLRVAARAARLAAEPDGGARIAHALVQALRGRSLPPTLAEEPDLSLYCADEPIDALFDRIAASPRSDVSLLLGGPPGTGKTVLAAHLARVLDRPLLVRRGSDLLSKWVGETEQRIAAAFREALERGGVLLFDEADSLLFDRASARANWEVGQINEMLTWLDRHPLPVIAATNRIDQLDPASLRRFVFKLTLRPLEPSQADRAWRRYFGHPAPPALAALRGLTPGDFAVVARQQRFLGEADPDRLLALLRAELAARPQAGQRIGFCM